MADLSRPDLCIVGAGALGIALAQHGRRLGASVVLVDRGAPEPGDGVQRALRLASLQASAARAHAMRNAGALGLPSIEPKISVKAVQERARQMADLRAPLDSHERLAALGIEIVTGTSRFVDAASLQVGEAKIRAKAFVLALGETPIVPAVVGLDRVNFFTPDTILENTRKLTHLLVIGGEATGLVLAQVFLRLGSQVTLVPQGSLLAGHDDESANILLHAIEQEGLVVVREGAVRALQARTQGIGALVDLPGGDELALDVSHVLVAAGGFVDLAGLDAEAARLQSRRGATAILAEGELGQTRNRRVRAAGIGAGFGQWQHAISHGFALVEDLVLGAPRRRPGAEPLLVMTDPPLAQIGRPAGLVDRLRPGFSLYRASLGENEAALALGLAQGLVKVTGDARGRIVGASAVGPGAAEMASFLALAKEHGLGLGALAHISAPHPALMASLVELGKVFQAEQKVSALAGKVARLRRLLPF